MYNDVERRILHIFREIYNGRGKHGAFLMNVAGAVIHADPGNFVVLKPVAVHLIGKYTLEKYLDNYTE